MTEKLPQYSGPIEPPIYSSARKPLADIHADAANPEQEEGDFEVVHVYPPVDGMPRLDGGMK